MDAPSLALFELGQHLSRAGYQFVTPTPETHRRVVQRRSEARDLRDVFGFSLPFARGLLAPALFELAERAGALREEGGQWRAAVRYSTLQQALFVHSAYPTEQADAVFFGPDTYRFCSYIARTARRARRVVDIGCGAGAGGLVAARVAEAEQLALVDINTRALAYAEVNTRLSGRVGPTEYVHSDVLASVPGPFDLIVANPPYMRDSSARTYRDGGGEFGEALSVRIVREALAKLAPGGMLLLYTGVAIVEGEDVFLRAVRDLVEPFEHAYEELDPDVFGEELDRPGYENVERLAAIALTVTNAS